MERRIEIPISDIMDDLVQRIMNQYGVERSDVRCLTKVECITFEIPALDEDLCNEVLVGMVNGDNFVDGCGGTAGGCICSLPKGHGNCHMCERCGEEWDTEYDI